MNLQRFFYENLRVSWTILPIFALLLLSAEFLAAQATISAGPPLLHQIRTIYVAPSSDEVLLLVRARLEKWNTVMISSKLDEVDAILTCQTTSTIVPAKAIVRITTAEVALVDRRTQRPIWRTTKSEAFDTTRLADELIEQLKKDWRKSASEY